MDLLEMTLNSGESFEVTSEDLGRGGYKLYQMRHGFRFGTDSVLLAWFASSFVRKSKSNVSVLELGANTGAVSVLVAARCSNTFIDSVELMEKEAFVLNKNIELNNLNHRMRGFNSDIRILPNEVKNKQYDVVMMNPPYFNKDSGVIASNNNESRQTGRFEENGLFNDFVKTASMRVIPTSGFVCMILHAQRLTDAINAFTDNGLKPVRLLAVHPFEDKDASVFLLAGKKGSSGSDLKILPPLIMNIRKPDGKHELSDRIKEIYDKEHLDCFI